MRRLLSLVVSALDFRRLLARNSSRPVFKNSPYPLRGNRYLIPEADKWKKCLGLAINTVNHLNFTASVATELWSLDLIFHPHCWLLGLSSSLYAFHDHNHLWVGIPVLIFPKHTLSHLWFCYHFIWLLYLK